VGNRATVLGADLDHPLGFAQAHSFDLVVGSLVLHYVRDWERALGEVRQVLARDGALVFSTHHPTLDWDYTPSDYFTITQVTERWHKGSGEVEVTFWRRPPTAMTHAIAAAGFVIERLVEPEAVPQLRARDPVAYELIRTRPRLLFFRVRPAP